MFASKKITTECPGAGKGVLYNTEGGGFVLNVMPADGHELTYDDATYIARVLIDSLYDEAPRR